MFKYFVLFSILCSQLCFAKYNSQVGQDKYVNETFFKDKRDGVFLDIGAHDGISFSNTYYFEHELGWSGICLEPLPDVFAQLKKNRKSLCICGCANPEHNVYKDFLCIKGDYDMYSGLMDKYNMVHRQNLLNFLKNNKIPHQIIKVRCLNINKLLEEAKISHIDFFSIDTEGGELDILKSIDFNKVQIDVMTVEDNFKDPNFVTFLESKGYQFITALKQDKIFVRKGSIYLP